MPNQQMNKPAIKKLTLALFIMAVFALGYLRNFIFVTINAQASAVYYHDTRPVLNGFMRFTTQLGYSSLIQLKWFLTILFFLLFFLFSVAIIYLFFKEKLYLKICLVSYGFLLAAAGFITVAGMAAHSFSGHAYNIARNIMHITQSPFTVLLLLAFSYYHKRAVRS